MTFFYQLSFKLKLSTEIIKNMLPYLNRSSDNIEVNTKPLFSMPDHITLESVGAGEYQEALVGLLRDLQPYFDDVARAGDSLDVITILAEACI